VLTNYTGPVAQRG